MSNPTNPPSTQPGAPTAMPPTQGATPLTTEARLEELERRLAAVDLQIQERQATWVAQRKEIYAAEEKANTDTAMMARIASPALREELQLHLATARQRAKDMEDEIRAAKAERAEIEGRIDRIRSNEEARRDKEEARRDKEAAYRAQQTANRTSILSLVVGALGAFAAIVGVCGKAPPQDLKVTCVPGVSAPAIPAP
ncbi:hypothetical protein HMI51_03345 [Corallococcus coralloides]|nr:hypothetical protein [Corallococcus coralloides]